MSLREAAEKALEALELAIHTTYSDMVLERCNEADKALRTALAEAEEPVAWYRPSEEGYDSAFRDHATVVACTGNKWEGWIPLYTHPPRREPLTEEEIRRLYRKAWTPESEADEVLAFARAVERAHGVGGDE